LVRVRIEVGVVLVVGLSVELGDGICGAGWIKDGANTARSQGQRADISRSIASFGAGKVRLEERG
jgi:hypothetical protein